MNGWIGMDLDGTLAYYDGTHHDRIGPPIPLMVDRARELLRRGYDVRIVTARVAPQPEPRDLAATRKLIRAWCKEHIGQELPITCRKDYGMILLFDDRCVAVETNTGRLLNEATLPLRTEDGK